jgi:nitrate reductase NapE component
METSELGKIVKITLAILMLLCLFDMPYGFYQLVRFAALVGFAMLAYFSYTQEKQTEMITFVVLAVLFQPLAKIALGRTLWNVVDVIVAIGLVVSLFVKPKKNE